LLTYLGLHLECTSKQQQSLQETTEIM